ncbi:uL22 family ribosomal protein [Candidatus Berkelbacteria bacterium]|nr:uL22 family ribosomal protein [Candidatus Berkelbacteria bacterium]
MQVTVHYNKLLIAPRKIRAVLGQLRHTSIPMALAQMKNSPRTTTEPIYKLLLASISAARDRDPAIRPEELRVQEIFCNEARRLYRTRIKSRGRAGRFAKRGSHLTLVVERTQKDQE